MNKEIYYWSPFTSPVATVKAVINSAISIKKFGKGSLKATIINSVGEWDGFKDKNDLNFIDLNSNNLIFNKIKNKRGFIVSRFYYWYIFIKSFLPLFKILKNKEPDYLIIHLITSLPIIMFCLFKFKTKLVLRISGLPKLNLVRKIIWKYGSQKIYRITCPTQATYDNLSHYEFLKEKLILLNDPVLNIKECLTKKKKIEVIEPKLANFINSGDLFLLIGRLTKQKNFDFLLKNIKNFDLEGKNLRFLIIGVGEDKKKLLKIVKKNNIERYVQFLDHTDNVFYFMSKSKAFILTSLWEDPGFVLIESAFANCSIISSDCPNGPKEIIGNYGGFLFSSNNGSSFLEVFKSFLKSSDNEKYMKKIYVKKKIKNFSIFYHYLKLKNILDY